MTVREVHYSRKFIKELRGLPEDVVERVVKKEEIFRKNPLHPSLRLYGLKGSLKGLWSISITGRHRIIFQRMKNGDILFISVGKHDIYKNL